MVGGLTQSLCLTVKTRTEQPTSEEEEEVGKEEGPQSKCDSLATYGSRRASIAGAWLKIDPASELS